MSTPDPFAVFDLPRRFPLDQDALHAAWLRQSAALHPDRMRDPLERADAADRIAQLNAARTTLANDERRANALHALLGGPTARDDASLPDGFLMEIMEVRESMERALSSDDAGERAPFEAWADERRAAHVTNVTDLFAAVDAASGDEARRPVLERLRTELNAWRYIERMIEQLDPNYDAFAHDA